MIRFVENKQIQIMRTIFETITSQITELKEESKYNRGRIFKRARYIYKNSICTWSEALIQSWDEVKKVVLRKRIELKAAIKRMAQQYDVKLSAKYYTDEMNNNMMSAYLSGAKMN
jgi:hypothetical protein